MLNKIEKVLALKNLHSSEEVSNKQTYKQIHVNYDKGCEEKNSMKNAKEP